MNCCGKPLPAVYDDSFTYMELIGKIENWLNELTGHINDISIDVSENSDDIERLQEYMYEINKIYEDFLDGKVPQSYIIGISRWLDENLQCVVNRTVKFFSLGIDDNGHIYVDMPYTWRWVKFSWNMDYESEDFGKIQLEW